MCKTEESLLKPEITVVVPAYNVENYIGRCLNSLLIQSADIPCEIIVVNDGSQDNTLGVVTELAQRYSTIRIINHEKNSGLSCARNTGIRFASGEYIVFVDSDDYVSHDYLAKLYTAAKSSDADIVCCNYRNVGDSSGKGIANFIMHRCGVFSGRKVFGALIRDITVRSYVWNKLYRRSLFTDNGIEFPAGMNFEDAVIAPMVFYHAEKIAMINDTLYNYVHRKGSITGSISKRDVLSYVRAFAAKREFLESNDLYEEHRLSFKLLHQKVLVTVFGMLFRCWLSDPAETHMWRTFLQVCRFMRIYATDRYYFESESTMDINLAFVENYAE